MGGFQGLKTIYEIGSTKTASCPIRNFPQGQSLKQVWPVQKQDPDSKTIDLEFWDNQRMKKITVVKSTQVRTFDEAKAYCDQFGMTLPVPQTKAECQEIGSLAEPRPQGRFYLGIRYDLNEFRNIYNHQPSQFFNWRKGEPNNHRYTAEKEVEIHKDGT